MPKVLTTASHVDCLHSGHATLSSTAKLQVAGAPVLLETGTSAWTIAGCTVAVSNAPTKPCTKLMGVLAGASTKLSVGGVAVLLETFRASTDGVPTPSTASAGGGAAKLEAP